MKKKFFSPNSQYFLGVLWINLVAFISNGNDIITRYVSHLPAFEVTFFRYFFAVVLLLPIMCTNFNCFKTSIHKIHIIRALLLFGAISCWIKAINKVPLAILSTLALTVPLFTLPLAKLFLQEKIGLARIMATIIGFIGIMIISFDSDTNFNSYYNFCNSGVILLAFASFMFAISDIINKKYVTSESNLSMLFYIALYTAIIAGVPFLILQLYPNLALEKNFLSAWIWIMPSAKDFLFLVILGAGGNAILFCLLKAFKAADISALAPYRYSELIFAFLLGYIIFNEIPRTNNLIGIVVIIYSTAFIAYKEIKHYTNN